MYYWLDLFTGTTWQEYLDAGANVSGFRARKRNICKKVKPGDIFLCYLTGVMRWVGAIEVIGPTDDKRVIWKEGDFPVRFAVKPIVLLKPETGVPMADLEEKVAFYTGAKDRGKFKGFVRGSPNLFKNPEDGILVLGLLKQAKANPIVRPVDPKKLARKPLYKVIRKKGRKRVTAHVIVPDVEKAPLSELPVLPPEENVKLHTKIQYLLMKLGAEMGYDIWVARNDRSREWHGRKLGALPKVVTELPTQFDDATNRTIELIDVLWLKGNSIHAAFEVESTTSIYSGLLRMSDLLSLQPNLNISLFLVAPDERRDKVEQEISRPTFKFLDKPLSEVCGFLSFSKLMDKLDGIQKLGLTSSLKSNFLKNTAEYFHPEDNDV